MDINFLLRRYPLLSDQMDTAELQVLLTALTRTIEQGVDGAVVELGCYVGTTSVFISRLLKEFDTNREFHVYDSFAGLPEKTSQDASPAGMQFKAGELTASKQAFIKHYRQAGLQLPHIHKIWFADLTAQDLPKPIAFAFLDGDFYESIRDSLQAITPHLSEGATIVIDDYQSEALPGAKKATDEWLRTRSNCKLTIQSSLAIIHI